MLNSSQPFCQRDHCTRASLPRIQEACTMVKQPFGQIFHSRHQTEILEPQQINVPANLSSELSPSNSTNSRHLRDALLCSPKNTKTQNQPRTKHHTLPSTPDNHDQSFRSIASFGTSSELDHTFASCTDNIICFITQHPEVSTL